MERHATEEAEMAKKILDFYVGLVEDSNSTAKFYLADNVVLDWFGKTIKDNKKVAFFIKDEVKRVTHHFENAYPSENVTFRDTHHVTVPSNGQTVLPPPPQSSKTSATPKKSQPSTSSIEIGQGDGAHNHPLISPPKKIKLGSDDEGNETMEDEAESMPMKYVTAEGSIEFHRPSIKKLQTETRWRRPVKLHLGYTASNPKDCTIYLIIYEGNLKCRRNLYKEFCEPKNSTNNSV